MRPRNGPPDAVSTIRRTHGPASALGVLGPQALVHRAVLAVDRDELARPRRLTGPAHHGPAGDQRLLVGQRQAAAGGERRQRDPEAGEARPRR